MSALLVLAAACGGGEARGTAPPPSEPEPMPLSTSDADLHTRNLRFRDNRAVFNDSARWLDTHRDEALPVMGRLLAEQGPEAIGIARVLGAMDDPRVVPLLEPVVASDDDALAYEAARALSRTTDAEAAAALRRAAARPEPGAVKNALRGIELRGDPALCDAVRAHLGDPEPAATHARRALEALGCEGAPER